MDTRLCQLDLTAYEGREVRVVIERPLGSQHPRRPERDLTVHRLLDVPSGQRLDVALLDEGVVLVAEEVLQQDAEREGQARHGAAGERCEGVEPVVDVGLPVHSERVAALEAVLGGHTAI